MFFWNSLAFFDDPVDVDNLISGSSAFSKSSLNIWKFMVHILLKPGLENFKHYFTSMWDECNCVVVWASLAWPFRISFKIIPGVISINVFQGQAEMEKKIKGVKHNKKWWCLWQIEECMTYLKAFRRHKKLSVSQTKYKWGLQSALSLKFQMQAVCQDGLCALLWGSLLPTSISAFSLLPFLPSK